jgi:hypothetical protein
VIHVYVFKTIFKAPDLTTNLLYIEQGRIHDFKLGGVHLKKIVPSGGRREHFWGISCEKSRFYDK